MGRRSSKVYLVRDVRNGLLEVFLPHPTVRNAYVKLPPYVVVNECSTCGAKPFEPCTGQRGKLALWAHGDRRNYGGDDRRKAQAVYKKLGILQTVTIDPTAQDFTVCQLPLDGDDDAT